MRRDRVVASALIRNTEGLILVFESQSGFAALPGGISEQGETPEETAIRESFEETGLGVRIEKLVTIYRLTVLNKDGSEKSIFLHYLFLTSTTDSEARPSSEWKNSGAKCNWVALSDLSHYRNVWPLPEEVRTRVSRGILDLGDMGELEYRMG